MSANDTPTPTSVPDPIRVPAWVSSLCSIFAGIGGIALLAMMLITVASVVLRTVIGKPIPGDYEMVQYGSAIAIFCFLPWCQLRGGNVLVDFFTQKTGGRTNHLLEAIGDLFYVLIAALLLWRLYYGGIDLHEDGEQTMVLRIPLWTSFVVILPAMALLTITAASTFVGHLKAARL
ncbi:MAG: TRAP transporter small permease [Pseudorhodobacter sp.]